MALSKKLADDISERIVDITEAVETNLDRFKKLLCQCRFISDDVRDRENMTSTLVMKDFKKILRLKTDYTALQGSCTKFLSILQELGPPASDLVGSLRDQWNQTAREFGPYKESAFLSLPHQEANQEETDNHSMQVSSSDTQLYLLQQKQPSASRNTAPAKLPLRKPNSIEESSFNASKDATSPLYMTGTQDSNPMMNNSKAIWPTAETGPNQQYTVTEPPSMNMPFDYSYPRPVPVRDGHNDAREDENAAKLREKVEKYTDEVKSHLMSMKYCNDNISKELQSIRTTQDQHTNSLGKVRSELKNQLQKTTSNDELRDQLQYLKSSCDKHVTSLESIKDQLKSANEQKTQLMQLEQKTQQMQLEQKTKQIEEHQKELDKQKSNVKKKIELLAQKESDVKKLETVAKETVDLLEKNLKKRERHIDQKLTSMAQSEIKQYQNDCKVLLADAMKDKKQTMKDMQQTMKEMQQTMKDMQQTLYNTSRNINSILIFIIVLLVIFAVATLLLLIFRMPKQF